MCVKEICSQGKKCGPPKEDKGWGFESFDSHLAQEGKQPLVVCLY